MKKEKAGRILTYFVYELQTAGVCDTARVSTQKFGEKAVKALLSTACELETTIILMTSKKQSA